MADEPKTPEPPAPPAAPDVAKPQTPAEAAPAPVGLRRRNRPRQIRPQQIRPRQSRPQQSRRRPRSRPRQLAKRTSRRRRRRPGRPIRRRRPMRWCRRTSPACRRRCPKGPRNSATISATGRSSSRSRTSCDAARYLRDAPDARSTSCSDLTATDWPPRAEARFDVVYCLYSTRHRHRVRVKIEGRRDTAGAVGRPRSGRPPTGSSARSTTCSA